MRVLLVVFILLAQDAVANELVNLRTSLWPPYQLMLQGEVSGISIEALDCIFKHLDEPFNVQVMPWARAIHDLKTGEADGLFTSIPSDELNLYATMSSPFTLEKWYWYFIKKPNGEGDYYKNLRIGAVRYSSQAQWLRSEGYSNIEEVNQGEQLLFLLEAGRIDAFIADELYFRDMSQELFSEQGQSPPELLHHFLRYTPLGVYFSAHFLSERPDFLNNFNHRIAGCTGKPVLLSENEEAQIQTIYEARIRPLLNRLDVHKALKEQNQRTSKLDKFEISELDKAWRLEKQHVDLKSGDSKLPADGSLINELLSRPLSKVLTSLQDDSHGLFNEIFLVDRYGLNVGQSLGTTHYFQGDENAFKETVIKMSDAIYIGGIEYDASAMTFQVQVSASVMDSSGELIGMLTVGINIEKALRLVD